MFRVSAEWLRALPPFTAERPLRLLLSACLRGEPCGVDGSSYGDYPWIRQLIGLPTVRAIGVCPEQLAFGTPRDLPDIHGGDGFDVLDGRARVLSDKGEDWSAGMVAAAQRMLDVALSERVDLAILMDMSAACGSQVISDGCRLVEHRPYRKGPGVAAALLIRNNVPVMSQRDFSALEKLRHKLDPAHPIDPSARDHHESDWYRQYFGPGGEGGPG
jgi:uncharacterized protein YbbK (DUF523 family)